MKTDTLTPLNAIGPIDGRYRGKVLELSAFLSEAGLTENRLIAEAEYLIALSDHKGVDILPLNKGQKRSLFEIIARPDAAQIVKDIEVQGYEDIPATNHDVKSVEYFISHFIEGTDLEAYKNYIHFALTSEDTTSVAISLMVMRAKNDIMIPTLEKLVCMINKLAKEHCDVPMLARTHGQPATPTTVGKEFRIFARRLERELEKLHDFSMLTKLNGASGNYNAHVAAYPDVDWIEFTDNYIRGMGTKYKIKLEVNHHTTQIESHDRLVELFQIMKRVNVILIDFCADMWQYISDNWLVQKPVKGEIGSSTMPHKVNPIDFENGEGNLGIANSFLTEFEKLPISRRQRHLSDSTVLRNIGSAFAHILLSFKSIMKGLGKISVNSNLIIQVLQSHPEVLTEAFQTIMRRYGVTDPYELLKELSRGKPTLTLEDFHDFIDTVDIPEEAKERMRAITPTNYIGLAPQLAVN